MHTRISSGPELPRRVLLNSLLIAHCSLLIACFTIQTASSIPRPDYVRPAIPTRRNESYRPMADSRERTHLHSQIHGPGATWEVAPAQPGLECPDRTSRSRDTPGHRWPSRQTNFAFRP